MKAKFTFEVDPRLLAVLGVLATLGIAVSSGLVDSADPTSVVNPVTLAVGLFLGSRGRQGGPDLRT